MGSWILRMMRKLGYFHTGRARMSIRDGPKASDTQRDEWLLKTEPLQGARTRWNKGERPPVIPDGVLDLEATGGVVGRNVEHHGTPTPIFPLERQILQEVEVVTPPRRGDFSGHPDKGRRFVPTE